VLKRRGGFRLNSAQQLCDLGIGRFTRLTLHCVGDDLNVLADGDGG
jgi:hypothetical protein